MHKYGKLSKSFQELWSTNPLLDIVGQLLGPGSDIAGNPVWNQRIKLPNNSQSTVPFHQDNAYMNKDSWENLIIVAWIPLVNANEVNGTLQVLKNAQRAGVTAEHTGCFKDTWYIDISDETIEKELNVRVIPENIKTINVNRGSALFLTHLLPHRSSNNNSSSIRWSIDFRFNDFLAKNGCDKSNLLLRKKDIENIDIEWDLWAKENRHESKFNSEIDLSTTIHGPWMDMWKRTNENEHTRERDEYLKQVKKTIC
jgi:hypothetical protein